MCAQKRGTVNRQLIINKGTGTRRGRRAKLKEEKERKKWSGACVGTRWHDLEGRGRVQARLKLPLCLTDLETARFAIACDSIGPHATRLIRGTKNCPPRHESYPPYVEFCKWNFPVSGGNILPTGVQRIGFPQFLFFSFFSLFLFDDSFNESRTKFLFLRFSASFFSSICFGKKV